MWPPAKHHFVFLISRFIAIKYPFSYTEYLTGKNSKRLIAGVWLFSLFWSLIGLFRWDGNGSKIGVKIMHVCLNDNYNYYAASSFGIYVTVLIIITSTYFTILHVALKQIQAIEANQVPSRVDTSMLCAGKDSPTSQERLNKRRKRKLTREIRATKSVAIVFLAYVICWLPLYVINIIILIDSNHFPKMLYNDPGLFLFIYYTFVEILPALNTCVNPFIYSFSNTQFRDAFKLILSKTLGLKLNLHTRDDFTHSIDVSSLPTSPAVSHSSFKLRKP
jgi:7 transmembrane receptor (rhodopsin family).